MRLESRGMAVSENLQAHQEYGGRWLVSCHRATSGTKMKRLHARSSLFVLPCYPAVPRGHQKQSRLVDVIGKALRADCGALYSCAFETSRTWLDLLPCCSRVTKGFKFIDHFDGPVVPF
jgi:hypothetical protein